MMAGNRRITARPSKIRLLQAAVLLLVIVFFGYAYTSLPETVSAEGPIAETNASEIEAIDTDPSIGYQSDYSRFRHANESHSRLPCLLCHRRDDGSTRIRFPGKPDHLPCAGCHVQQFADNTGPMCTICHTNPQTGAMKGFPRLKSFNVKFDHGRHLRQTNCATCHKPTRRGVAFSMPAGGAAHATCFQCHTAATPLSSCDTCHSPGRPVRASEWAKAYNANFSHQEHLTRGKTNCTSCHSVLAGQPRGRQVTSPAVSMHFARAGSNSCGNCHNSKRAFGISDFSNCRKCHEGKTFRF